MLLKDEFPYLNDISFLDSVKRSATFEEWTTVKEEILKYEALSLKVEDSLKDVKLNPDRTLRTNLQRLGNSWGELANPKVRLLIKLNSRKYYVDHYLSLLFELPPESDIFNEVSGNLITLHGSSTLEYLKSNQSFITPSFLAAFWSAFLGKFPYNFIELNNSILELTEVVSHDISRSLEDRFTYIHMAKTKAMLTAPSQLRVGVAYNSRLNELKQKHSLHDIPESWIIETYSTASL